MYLDIADDPRRLLRSALTMFGCSTAVGAWRRSKPSPYRPGGEDRCDKTEGKKDYLLPSSHGVTLS